MLFSGRSDDHGGGQGGGGGPALPGSAYIGASGVQEALEEPHLKVGGHEAGEWKLVNVRREGQAGPDRNLRWQGLCDAPRQGGLVAWEERNTRGSLGYSESHFLCQAANHHGQSDHGWLRERKIWTREAPE